MKVPLTNGALVEPRDSYASTLLRKTILVGDATVPDPVTYTVQENPDRVGIIFIVFGPTVMLTPNCPTNNVSFGDNDDPITMTGFPVSDDNVSRQSYYEFLYGDYGPLVQTSWTVVKSSGAGQVCIIEIFDNPPVRKELCK